MPPTWTTRSTLVPVGIGTALAVALTVQAARGTEGPASQKKARTAAKAVVEVPALNVRIVAFARGQVGKKVGNGECTALAAEALRRAGGRRFMMQRTGGDFIWGKPVKSFGEALLGDVVQFRNAVFRGKTRLPGGRVWTWWQEYPHHTAIVSEVRDGGRLVTVLHQNIGPEDRPEDEKRLVQETTIRPDALQPGGKLWIYRPVALDPSDHRGVRGELPAGGALPPDPAAPPG